MASNLNYIQYTEPMAGAGGIYTDTLNRVFRNALTLSGYNADSTTFPGLSAPVYNVKAFGAVGNGTADDTTPIQNAINAAASAAASPVSLGVGACVVLPAGYYKVTAQLTLPDRVQLVGAGAYASQLQPTFADYCIRAGTTGATYANHISVRDLSIIVGSTTGGGLRIQGTNAMDVQNVYIEGVPNGSMTGIYFDGQAAGNIFTALFNVTINHTKTGIILGSATGSSTTSVTGTSVNIFGDTPTTAGSIGIRVDPGNGNGSHFYGGNIERLATGFSGQGFGVELVAVRFEANTTDFLIPAGLVGSEGTGHVMMACSGPQTISDTDNKGWFWANVTSSGTVLQNKMLGTWQQEAITTASLTNGWLAYGSGYETPSFWKDQAGVVHLRGSMKSGTMTAGTTLFTLPTGYRPANTQRMVSAGNGVLNFLVIQPTGLVQLEVALSSNAVLSIDGCSFGTN